MFRLFNCCVALLLFTGCQKEISLPGDILAKPATVQLPADSFVQYHIKAGENYCDKNEFKLVEKSTLRFLVRFDSSAVYTTTDPANQYDINKLYGFSDNNSQHHLFSARFGWRWSDGALRLFGYVYNNGVIISREINTVVIGSEVQCTLKVNPSSYYFTVDKITDSLPRQSTTPQAKGYQLYPYFGGDEPAPHAITISIKEN
jgi:hypothetical protein